MSESTPQTEEIADAVIRRLLEHRRLDQETHAEHHAFIELLIKREAKRDELRRKFQASFVGAAAVATVSGLGWIGTLVIQWIRKGAA